MLYSFFYFNIYHLKTVFLATFCVGFITGYFVVVVVISTYPYIPVLGVDSYRN